LTKGFHEVDSRPATLRVEFASAHVRDDDSVIRRVAYIDERLFASIQHLRFDSTADAEEIPYRPTTAHVTKVMVCGAISWWSKTRLRVWPSGTMVDSKEYLKTVKSVVIPTPYFL